MSRGLFVCQSYRISRQLWFSPEGLASSSRLIDHEISILVRSMASHAARQWRDMASPWANS